MGVAVGSSIQVALFAVPFAVVVGWATGHPFTLFFDPFSALALMLSVAQVGAGGWAGGRVRGAVGVGWELPGAQWKAEVEAKTKMWAPVRVNKCTTMHLSLVLDNTHVGFRRPTL